MNLIQQFPDISMNIRARLKPSFSASTANAPVPYDQHKALQKFYENSFRIWHFKVAFIIASILGSIYALLLNSNGLFKWMLS